MGEVEEMRRISDIAKAFYDDWRTRNEEPRFVREIAAAVQAHAKIELPMIETVVPRMRRGSLESILPFKERLSDPRFKDDKALPALSYVLYFMGMPENHTLVNLLRKKYRKNFVYPPR